MIVVAFRDGKDIVHTVLFQGMFGIAPEWYRSRAALELARHWNRTALENDAPGQANSTAQGVLKCYESHIDVVQPTEIKACPCCGLGEPQGQCHVCGNKNDMPKHADGVCWSCRDPFVGPGVEDITDHNGDKIEVGAEVRTKYRATGIVVQIDGVTREVQVRTDSGCVWLHGGDMIVTKAPDELPRVLQEIAAVNPNIKNFSSRALEPATDLYVCQVCGGTTPDKNDYIDHLAAHGIRVKVAPRNKVAPRATESGECDVR